MTIHFQEYYQGKTDNGAAYSHNFDGFPKSAENAQ
jgi:hypothetical protein